MDQKLKNYSSGMQVRLAFSIAVRAKSDILLLDEVLAVGDSAFQRKCYRYFEEMRNSGTTIVLVTHDMGAVQRFCQRAILLDNGKIVKSGEAGEIADEYRSINMNLEEEGGPKVLTKHNSVEIDILKQTSNTVTFRMSHREKDNEKYYFGFSVIKDGVTFAEMNSLYSDKAKFKNKSLTYELDVEKFNPGIYEIGATLFKTKNKEPAAYAVLRPQFIIKGEDPYRGGALKLADKWE